MVGPRQACRTGRGRRACAAVAAVFALNGFASGAAVALVAGAAGVGWIAGRRRESRPAGASSTPALLVVSVGLLRASPTTDCRAILLAVRRRVGHRRRGLFRRPADRRAETVAARLARQDLVRAIVGAVRRARRSGRPVPCPGGRNRIDRLFWLGLAAGAWSQSSATSSKSGAQAALRGQGFEPPHPRPRRPDGSARRLHRGAGLRRGRRRRQLQGVLDRRRAFPMVNRPDRRPRRGGRTPERAPASRHSRRDRLDRAIVRARHRGVARAGSPSRRWLAGGTARRSGGPRSSSARNSRRSPTRPATPI